MPLLPILFAVAWGVGAGATLDQTSPKVHDFTAKYIVGAEHDGKNAWEDKDGPKKR